MQGTIEAGTDAAAAQAEAMQQLGSPGLVPQSGGLQAAAAAVAHQLPVCARSPSAPALSTSGARRTDSPALVPMDTVIH